MKSFILTFFFWGLLSSTWATAQTVAQDSLMQLITVAETDSLKASRLIDLAKSYSRSDWHKEHEYASEAVALLNNTNYKQLKASAFHTLGISYLHKGESSDSSLIYFEQGLSLAKETGFLSKQADIFIGFGAFYHQTGIYDKAFENYQEAIAIAEKEGLQKPLCRALNNMAAVLVLEGEYDKAMPHYERALKTARELDNKLFISALLSNMGVAHNQLEEYDLALEKYSESLEIRRINNDKKGESLTICNIGNVYRNKSLFELALSYQIRGLEIAEEIDYIRGKAICLEGLTFTHFDWEKYEETIKYGQRGLAISEKANLLENQADFKELLGESFAALGDYRSAYQYQSELVVLEDSLWSLESSAQINELEAKYQLRQKETENQLLQEKQIRQEEVLQKRNVLIVAAFIILIMMSLLATVYYRSAKQKQAYNEQLQQAVEERTAELNHSVQVLKETNQELEDFAFIASHDLKEPLRSIISFNELIQRKLKGQIPTEVKDYFAFVNTSGQQMYHLIESTLEFSRLGKVETPYGPTDLNEIVAQTREHLQWLIQGKNAVIELEHLPTIHSNPDQLYLVFKNLIENGIKYNECATPKVSISYQAGPDAVHQVMIKDNGIGIEGEFHDKVFQMFKRLHDRGAYSGSGLGLSIANKIIQHLGGHIALVSEKGMGSTFIINIPAAAKF